MSREALYRLLSVGKQDIEGKMVDLDDALTSFQHAQHPVYMITRIRGILVGEGT